MTVAPPTVNCARPPSPVGVVAYGCDPDEAAMLRQQAPDYAVTPVITSWPLDAADIVAVEGCRCVTVSHRTPVRAVEIQALHRVGVEYVCTRSIGLDHIDLRAAADMGVTVEGVSYAPDGVADFTMMMILMVLRRAKELVISIDRHDLRAPVRGRDLRDLTVGVIGAGAIGSAVIRRLAGFGCDLLVLNTTPSTQLSVQPVTLNELLRGSDVVTVHVPLNPDTHHMIGRSEIEKMKPGAILVNTARGAVIDNDALAAALEDGHLGGAAVDVIEREHGTFYIDHSGEEIPHPFLQRLVRLPNAVVTPHTAYATHRSLHETIQHTLAGCVRFEQRRTAGKASARTSARDGKVLG